jgi:hypothetical protein
MSDGEKEGKEKTLKSEKNNHMNSSTTPPLVALMRFFVSDTTTDGIWPARTWRRHIS